MTLSAVHLPQSIWLVQFSATCHQCVLRSFEWILVNSYRILGWHWFWNFSEGVDFTAISFMKNLSSSNVWRTISRPGHLKGIPFSIIMLPCMCPFLHASRIWAGCTWTPLIICSVRFGFLASSFYLHQGIFSVIIEPEPMTCPLETGVTLDQLNIPMVLKAPIAHGLSYFLCLWAIGV